LKGLMSLERFQSVYQFLYMPSLPLLQILFCLYIHSLESICSIVSTSFYRLCGVQLPCGNTKLSCSQRKYLVTSTSQSRASHRLAVIFIFCASQRLSWLPTSSHNTSNREVFGRFGSRTRSACQAMRHGNVRLAAIGVVSTGGSLEAPQEVSPRLLRRFVDNPR
jgi:hypothetical protein